MTPGAGTNDDGKRPGDSDNNVCTGTDKEPDGAKDNNSMVLWSPVMYERGRGNMNHGTM